MGGDVVHDAEKGADGGTTAKIEPHQLDDYRQFLIGFDKLHGGTGLKRRHSDHNHYRNHASDRPDLFTHVTVNRADLMRCFAADRQLPPDFNLLMPTGEPGRPTKGKQIYSAEHQRRCKSGIALVVLACEVDHLVAWFKTQHPEAAPPTAKTVSNRIRAAHREYKASQSPKNIDIA